MSRASATSESRTIKNIESAFFFLSLPFFIMGLLLPVYGRELGASALEIGVIFSAFSVMTILMRPLGGGWLYDSINPPAPFLATGVILSLCALVLVLFLQIPKPAHSEMPV